jgi:hypothetical protein
MPSGCKEQQLIAGGVFKIRIDKMQQKNRLLGYSMGAAPLERALYVGSNL